MNVSQLQQLLHSKIWKEKLSMSQSSDAGYPCPYCHQRSLETTATAPYVRGLLVAYMIGSKTFIGCVPCVRKKLLGEAGLSLVIGWFSLYSIVINPCFILYNLMRTVFVKPNPNSVAKNLAALGLPASPQVLDINMVGCALAASMILADGKVEESELLAAEKAGDEVFDNFDEAALRMIVEHGKGLPPVEDLAMMLRDVIDQEAKEKVMVYLSEIALADGHVAPEERQMLARIGKGLGMQDLVTHTA
jgi:uncharacterized tellurite resistance protein B-like protein